MNIFHFRGRIYARVSLPHRAHQGPCKPDGSIYAPNFRYAPILRGPPRLNVDQFDAALQRPGQKMPAGKLRPIVRADRPRQPAAVQ